MFKSLTFTSLTLAFLIAASSLSAQSKTDSTSDGPTVNITPPVTKALLNQGGISQTTLDMLRAKPRTKDGIPVSITDTDQWQSLYRTLAGADMRDEKQRLKPYETLVENDIEKRNHNAVLPVGILNFDASFMTLKQLGTNVKRKARGQRPDSLATENLFIFAASVLQSTVYQGDVTFRISPDLNFTNVDNPIKRIEIDFQDGKGFQAVELTEQLIKHQYIATGDHGIGFRFTTKRGVYLAYSSVTVAMLERAPVYKEFDISAKAVKSEAVGGSTRNARISDVPGGRVRILNGCDGVFDRPIIIGEGFDMGNNATLDDLEANYYPALYALRNAGYDLVLLDYWDARIPIQDNADVMTNLINQVNQLKTGNDSLIVIGESMSGLVARWALRAMEINGQTHNVSHYISFDSPHKGANIPPGLIDLYRTLPAIGPPWWLAQWLSGFSTGLRNMLTALDSPAARQMLLSNIQGGVPDPAFVQLQADLNNLGFPQQCRNVAVVNGNRAGLYTTSRQTTIYGTQLSPGDEILSKEFWAGILNFSVKIRTNKINGSGETMSFTAFSIITNPVRASSSMRSNRNIDLTPGGYKDNLENFDPGFRFSFVPVYSGIAYSGPLVSDQDQYITTNNIPANLTPFAAIYGLNINRPHTIADAAVWSDLAQNEFGINRITTSCGPPPVPTFTGTRQQICNLDIPLSNGASADLRAIYTVAESGKNGEFDYRWTISPNPTGLNLPSGPTTTVDTRNLPFGSYTVTCYRTYAGTTAPVTTFSQILVILCPFFYGCYVDDGGFVYRLNDTGQDVFARYYNSVLFATTSSGEFVSRSRLIANGYNATQANCFAETDPRPAVATLNSGSCYTVQSQKTGKIL